MVSSLTRSRGKSQVAHWITHFVQVGGPLEDELHLVRLYTRPETWFEGVVRNKSRLLVLKFMDLMRTFQRDHAACIIVYPVQIHPGGLCVLAPRRNS